jgi:hypothetical protein
VHFAGATPPLARSDHDHRIVQRLRAGAAGLVAWLRLPDAAYPAAFTAWMSSAATFCASPYTMRVLSR